MANVSASDNGGNNGPDGEKPMETRRGHGRGKSALDVGFDRWLNKQLRKVYDPALNEPIPDDLRALLDKFEVKPKPDDKK